MTIQHAQSTILGLTSILILVFFSAILLLPLSPLNSSALHDSSTESNNCPNNNNILVVNPAVTNMSNLDSTIPIVGIFSLEELTLNNNNNDPTKGSTFLIMGIVNVTKVDGNSSEQRVVEIQGRLDNKEPREQSMVIANISSVSANFTINEQSNNNNNNTLDVILNDQRNTSLAFPLSSILNDNATSTTITNSTRIESNMMTIMAEIVRRLVHVDCSEEAIAVITNSRLQVMAQNIQG